MAKSNAPVSIVPFEARFATDFERLNNEWLRRYFRVEPIDAKVLGDPQTYIIDPGGIILMATLADATVGTCALKVYRPEVVELTKMAVTATAQRHGIGRTLAEAAVNAFRGMQANTLFLESHSSLKPALHLYESIGFEFCERPFRSEYERADVYMEWRDPLPGDRH